MARRNLRIATQNQACRFTVIALESNGGRREYAREHPWLVRFTHWLNAVTLVVMTMSGLQIFAAFPSFGPKIPQKDLVHFPEAMRLGGWLGGSLQWHLTFMWLFMACRDCICGLSHRKRPLAASDPAAT